MKRKSVLVCLILIIIPCITFGDVLFLNRVLRSASYSGQWVGNTVEDRGSATGANATIIDLNNTSPVSGSVTAISVYITAQMTSAEFASFTNEGGTDYSTNGSSGAVNLTTGLNELTAPTDFTAFSISSGDYIGMYVPGGGGGLEMDTSGAGVDYLSGDYIPCSSETFVNSADRTCSISFYVE